MQFNHDKYMKKVVLIFQILGILLAVSCKKDTKTIDSFNICYKEWRPDSTIYNYDTLEINLGCDNSNYKLYLISDISIYSGSTPSGGSYYNEYTDCVPLESNVFVSCGIYPHYPGLLANKNLLLGDRIDDNLVWLPRITVKGVEYMNGWIGWWNSNGSSVNEGFIGVKIVTPLGNKYGWLNISTPININQRELTIQSQAMNDNLNQFIKAGQIN